MYRAPTEGKGEPARAPQKKKDKLRQAQFVLENWKLGLLFWLLHPKGGRPSLNSERRLWAPHLSRPGRGKGGLSLFAFLISSF